MERLTERSLDYCTQHCPSEKMISCAFYKDDQAERCLIANMYDRLAAYEDTGLEPEQCAEYAQAEKEGRYILLKEPRSAGVHRLEEIARADIEGRLAVLPCKVGDTVWGVIFDTRDCPHCVGLSGCFGCSKANPVDVYRTDFKLHMVEKIGKTVFLTRAEAEAAMKGVSEDA